MSRSSEDKIESFDEKLRKRRLKEFHPSEALMKTVIAIQVKPVARPRHENYKVSWFAGPTSDMTEEKVKDI